MVRAGGGRSRSDARSRSPAAGIKEFTVPTPSSLPMGIAAGPDGDMWFTEDDANKIGRVTTKGAIKEFPIPSPNSGPNRIATGPDGNLWFTETNQNKIGRLRRN
jgi:virginiamycin B lyase